ncbi:protein TOC75, chloroplastic-like isoform X2 [Lotus japonicus]|uniref:protein TOC75, chloroplastic-like isoform X2 n=1 Tax=Lotus japonicus TaxID=34305 RepID=UPI002585A6C0|nr:protein TOC75, chloroplastic-like isoform X2 [Lotus japonicus]
MQPVWVNCDGVKAIMTEKFNFGNEITWGLVLERIKTFDRSNEIITHALPYEHSTTLSGTGMDQRAILESKVTIDTTNDVDGLICGSKIEYEGALGIGIDRRLRIINRRKLSATSFIPLMPAVKLPSVLVLHGLYGDHLGDIAPYDAFTLEGPYSVTNYNRGVSRSATNILENPFQGWGWVCVCLWRAWK